MARKDEASVDIKDENRLHGADEKRPEPVTIEEQKPLADAKAPDAPYPLLSNERKAGRLPSLPLGRRNR